MRTTSGAAGLWTFAIGRAGLVSFALELAPPIFGFVTGASLTRQPTLDPAVSPAVVPKMQIAVDGLSIDLYL